LWIGKARGPGIAEGSTGIGTISVVERPIPADGGVLGIARFEEPEENAGIDEYEHQSCSA
jgi:hypothetical protein